MFKFTYVFISLSLSPLHVLYTLRRAHFLHFRFLPLALWKMDVYSGVKVTDSFTSDCYMELILFLSGIVILCYVSLDTQRIKSQSCYFSTFQCNLHQFLLRSISQGPLYALSFLIANDLMLMDFDSLFCLKVPFKIEL